MEQRTNALLFPSTRNRGPASASVTLTFARDVERAVAAVTGYSATFANREDHHLGQLDLALTTTVDPANRRNVVVEGSFGLRDWSGSWDDAYSGTVQLAVLADLVPVAPPAPGDARGDLVITDAEITQGIQHFRSALHLDAANVYPDNSVRLVEGKPCGVRLWVDYDRNSGLPVIAALTGSLVVVDGAGIATMLAPLASITPKRESQISRGMRGDTLNFVIPEALCSGAVTIRASVRSAADPTAFSRDFERTLVFETMVPVRVFAVGVNYTGPDVVDGEPTAAPVQADFTSIFGVTELLYPIPQVTQTGYMTIEYAGELKSDISKGCDKFGDLRDDVKDLRGDSTDIFYALVNTGVDTGSVGGCGGGGGAGVGIIGRQGTVAHELGHILGRRHAPCDNVTRCARPLNTDGSYPSFPGYDSDSIGEFGFDVSTGAVFQPGTAHDMMGYSGNAWVSAYTYKALMTRIPIDGGGVADVAGTARALVPSRLARPPRRAPIEIRERIPGASEHIFLHLVVQRDRSVQRRAAFHFATGPQATPGRRTDFVLEFRDADDRVLAAHCLHQEDSWCSCGPDACVWPKAFAATVPFDPAARRLAVYECETLIHEEKIPDPPAVRLGCKRGDDRKSPVIHCEWGAEREADAATLWYLLQWRDRRGTWRGVAPRTQRTAWDVPKSLWGRGGGSVALRVLASSGIATGMAECEVAFAWGGGESGGDGTDGDGPRRVTIRLSGVDDLVRGTTELPPIVRATVTDSAAATVEDADVAWYGETGGMYGRGRSLHLAAVPHGVHVLRAAVANTSAGSGDASWLVERTRDDRFFLHRGSLTYPEPECAPGAVTVAPPRSRAGGDAGGGTPAHDHDHHDRDRHHHDS